MSNKTHLDCPECKHKACYTEFSDGGGYCFSCGHKKPGTMFSSIQKEPTIKVKELLPFTIVAMPARFLLKETCEKYNYGLGVLGGEKVHVANYYDKNNNLVAQKTRNPEKKFQWFGDHKKITLFGSQTRTPENKALVITEGEIDAMSVSQASGGSVCSVSVSDGAQSADRIIKENIDFIESFEKVILWFDNDEAGGDGIKKCSELISPKLLHIIKIKNELDESVDKVPVKDANDLLKLGLSENINKYIREAYQYKPDKVYKLGTIPSDRILQSLKSGISIPFPILSAKLHGLREGSVYTIAAKPKAGKTTFVTELLYGLAKAGHKVALNSFEESVEEFNFRMISLVQNKNPYSFVDSSTSRERESFIEQGSKLLEKLDIWSFDHFGDYELNDVYESIKYQMLGVGCKIVLLDNFSTLTDASIMSLQELNKYFLKYKQLCLRSNSILINIVHTVKNMQFNDDGSETNVVNARDISGTGAFSKYSASIIALEKGEDNESKLKLLYNRHGGFSGYCDTLIYNDETGRLTPKQDSGFESNTNQDELLM